MHNNPGRIDIEEGVHFCFLNNKEDNGWISDKKEPKMFQEAWWHPDLEEQKKWRELIRLKFRQMIKNGVWQRNNKSNYGDLPNGRKAIGMKWVFKIKKNNVYCSRLVAKGYNQIAGINFQYNFAPVINNTSIRVLLVIWLVNKFEAILLNVKTAFLHRNLEEDIFIHIPEGYKEFLKDEYNEETEETHLKLEKLLYGLVQAA